MSWTEQEIKTATTMWREGSSATEIAMALGSGKSRNAVVGKMHRLGLTGRSQANATSGHATVRRIQSREERALPNRETASPEPLPASEGVLHLDRRFNQCAFPITAATADMRVCGAETQECSPYCPEHHQRCYTKPSKLKGRRADHGSRVFGAF